MTVRGGHARAYKDDRQAAEEHDLAGRLRAELPVGWSTDGAYVVHIVAWFGRPARLKRAKDRNTGELRHLGKPDVDNVAKLVLDAATRAGVWRDDALVHTLLVQRMYLALDGEGVEIGLPRIEVLIEGG